MSFPPLASGDHSILSSEFCSGYVDISGVWNTGFYCPQTGSALAVYCCGTPTYKYCCTTKPVNGTGSGIVEDVTFEGIPGPGTTVGRPSSTITENDNFSGTVNTGAGGNDYSGATRMRPTADEDLHGFNSDFSSLNLSDIPIIFGVACGVAAVLILVILVGFYITSCCSHYHQLAQNRKRRSSMPGLYRGVATTTTSTNSGLANLYSPSHSVAGGATSGSLAGSLGGGVGIIGGNSETTQTYVVHHHQNPQAGSDSCTPGVDQYQLEVTGGGASSLVTTPLDIEWSSSSQYHQQPIQSLLPSSSSSQHQQQHPQPLNFFNNQFITDNRIQYTVHQTQNRLAVALTGSMNRLSDRASPCPQQSSSYPVNIPLTPPDSYSYQRPMSRGASPPPQYSTAVVPRAESPPYYPCYEASTGLGSLDNYNSLTNQHHNYLSRTSTLPLSLARKPPSGANRQLLTSPGPYASNLATPQQPKSILRTSQNYRRVVTNETPPPIPPHSSSSPFCYEVASLFPSNSSMEIGSGSAGNVAYRNVDCRTNLTSQPLLLLESNGQTSTSSDKLTGPENGPGPQISNQEEDQDELHSASALRRSSLTAAIHGSSVEEEEEEEEEHRDHFDIHDIDSDALSRLIELDLDSKL